MDMAKIFPQLMSKSRGLLSVSDSNKMQIKSLLYSREYIPKRERDGGPIFATLRLGIGQHSKMIYN